MIIHELKTDPEVFDAVVDGRKKFEIRKDDRCFLVGDKLLLRRTKFTGLEMTLGKPLIYTGESMHFPINYILRGPVYGLEKGWVIMS